MGRKNPLIFKKSLIQNDSDSNTFYYKGILYQSEENIKEVLEQADENDVKINVEVLRDFSAIAFLKD